MPDLFIGVVSHERTRFRDSQGPDGLASQLRTRLSDRGLAVSVQVNTANWHDAEVLPVTPRMVQQSLSAQLSMDAAWSSYVSGGRPFRDAVRIVARWIRRAIQFVRPPGVQALSRLLNIEFSHLDLLRAARASGATWALILEDDAAADDVADTTDGLAALIEGRAASADPLYVSVSQSFTNTQLGISSLLTDSGVPWHGATQRSVLSSRRPVTNTVCAILYRGSFLPALIGALDSVPVEPILPIDWKLNRALIDLVDSGALGAGDCWLVEPAPIIQRSMKA